MRARTLTAAVVLVGAGLTARAGDRPMAIPTPLGGGRVATAPAPRPQPDDALMSPRRSQRVGQDSLDAGLTLTMPRGTICAFPIPGTSLMVFTGPGLGGQAGGAPKATQPPTKGTTADGKAPLDRHELDRRIAHIVYDATVVGTELWELKNYDGTFRYYQATLAALYPLLDHRPKLAELAIESLQKTYRAKPTEGAFVLREALDAIQKETAAAIVTKPLWDRLGGEKGVRALVKDFLADATQKDGALTRGGALKLEPKQLGQLEQALAEAISEHAGGPLKSTGTGLKGVLAGTKLTDGEFIRLRFALGRAMVKNNVPTAESKELVEIYLKLKPEIVGQ